VDEQKMKISADRKLGRGPAKYWSNGGHRLFRRRVIALGLLSLLGVGNSSGATEKVAISQPCPAGNEQQIINAAIEFYISLAIQTRKAVKLGSCNLLGWKPGTPCVNTIPYHSIEEFKNKNPDCCYLLDKIPGDYPTGIRPYVRGEKHPKVYLVSLTFTRLSANRASPKPYQHHAIKAVDCYGNVLGQGFPP
jgi:hypothetical protein